jgi:hypothetical protein
MKMLKTILDNLTKRIEALEVKASDQQTVREIHSEQIEQLCDKCIELQSIINTLHAVSDNPIIVKKRGRPKISHVVGKLTKSNT